MIGFGLEVFVMVFSGRLDTPHSKLQFKDPGMHVSKVSAAVSHGNFDMPVDVPLLFAFKTRTESVSD